MLTIIKNVLELNELVAAQRFMANAAEQGQFNDGKLSAGKMAAEVKHNEELGQAGTIYEQLNKIVFKRLTQHPHFQASALPHKIAAPFFARYQAGMQYGYHVDDPIMGDGPRLRTDVATTVFLSEPDSYEGGELSIKTDFGMQQVKLAAGSAVVYPSSSLHKVAEVTSGERLAMVIWTQSMVRAPDQRALLYDLWLSRESLLAKQAGDEDTQRIDHCYANLVRMWAEV